MKIAFYKAWQPKGSYVDKLISVFTAGPYSHTELVFSDGMCFGISGRGEGARFKKIDLDPDKWEIVDLDITDFNETKLRERATGYNRIEYDYLGAFLCRKTPWCVHSKNKLFCSEVTVDLIRRYAGYQHLEKGCRYSPMRLYRTLKDK